MPSRIIKESTRTSDTLAQISAEAERLFWRLVVSADDYGRFDARPHIVLGHCLAPFLARGSVTVEDVSRWLTELERAGLIIRYVVDGKACLQLTTWEKHQRAPRAKDSKYPAPPADAGTSGHLLSNDSNCSQVPSDASESKESGIESKETRREGEEIASPAGDPLPITPERVAEIWNEVCGDILPRVTKLTPKRRQHVKARLAADRSRDESWWRGYFSRIRASPFCCGDNQRGWRADFEFAVRSEDVVAKVLEGKYDSRPRRQDHGVSDWTGQKSGRVDLRAFLRAGVGSG